MDVNKKIISSDDFNNDVMDLYEKGLAASSILKILEKKYNIKIYISTIKRKLKRFGYDLSRKPTKRVCTVCEKVFDLVDENGNYSKRKICSRKCLEVFSEKHKKTSPTQSFMSEDTIKKIIEYAKEGKMPTEISKLLNGIVSNTSVRKIMNKHGFSTARKKVDISRPCIVCGNIFTPKYHDGKSKKYKTCSPECLYEHRKVNRLKYTNNEIKKVIELRKKGEPIKTIIEKTNVKKSKIKEIIKENNIKIDKEIEIRNVRIGRMINEGTIKSKDSLDKVEKYINSEEFSKLAKDNDIVFILKYLNNKFKDDVNLKYQNLVNLLRHNNIKWKKSPKTSISEKQIYNYIVQELGIKNVIENTKTVIWPYEIDIYIPDKKLAIEFNGLYWHCELRKDKKNHMNKYYSLLEKGINLFAIYEDEWRDKQDLIKAMIRHRLGILPDTKLRASKLEIRKLEKNKDFRDFFEKYHIDGYAISKFAYGLFYNNELVSCASFIKNKDYLEIKRFASNYNYYIYGALGKILKTLKENEDLSGYKGILSYSNNRLSSGKIYDRLNFKEITKNPQPSYYYTDFINRVFRTKCQRINDPEILKDYPTERAQALGGIFSKKYFGTDRPVFRIYDYSHRKWIMEF